MAQQKHKKGLYIVAAILVILPFFGIPQPFKTLLFVVLGLLVAYIAFSLPEDKEDEHEEPAYVENGNDSNKPNKEQSRQLWEGKGQE